MAIQPIDLQTLFTQVDKIGRTQVAEKEGVAIQQAMHGVQMQRKAEQDVQSVNKVMDQGDGVEKVKDRRQKDQQQGAEMQEQEDDEEEAVKKENNVIRDPLLGKNIDISL